MVNLRKKIRNNRAILEQRTSATILATFSRRNVAFQVINNVLEEKHNLSNKTGRIKKKVATAHQKRTRNESTSSSRKEKRWRNESKLAPKVRTPLLFGPVRPVHGFGSAHRGRTGTNRRQNPGVAIPPLRPTGRHMPLVLIKEKKREEGEHRTRSRTIPLFPFLLGEEEEGQPSAPPPSPPRRRSDPRKEDDPRCIPPTCSSRSPSGWSPSSSHPSP